MHDILCKSLGSANHINVARATIAGLKSLQRPDEVAARRGLPAEEFVPKGMLKAYNERQRGARPRWRRGPARWPELTVTQVKSGIGAKPKTRGTLRALGLGRIGKSNTLPDRPEVRGMIARVPHLVRVTESASQAAASTAKTRPGPRRLRPLEGRSKRGSR